MLPLSYDRLRVQPGRDGLAFLAAQPGVDPTRLLLIGHSEGGAVAMMIATDPDAGPAPAALALVEPAYTHILDVVSRQFADQMDGAASAGAMTPEDAATLETWMDAGVTEIRDEEPPYPDPAALVPSIAIPTLITCGTKDFNTPCGDGTPGSGVIALADAFTPGVARFITLPNTIHILRDVGGADVPNIADQLAYPFSSVFAAEFRAFAAGLLP